MTLLCQQERLCTSNVMEKDKKKTLTISSDLKKKIDTTSISTSGKKSFSVEKKRPVRLGKPIKNNQKDLFND
mgnify:CR=1 FL=1